MTSTIRVKVENLHLVEKSCNKTVIDFNFGRHEVLSTLKIDIYLCLATLVNYHIFGWIHLHVYLIEVNICIIVRGDL